MVRGDLIIKIYRRLAKKRYLRGKHTYEHERIYVPIPSRLHDIVRPFLNQRLKNTIHSELNAMTTIFSLQLFALRKGLNILSVTEMSIHNAEMGILNNRTRPGTNR